MSTSEVVNVVLTLILIVAAFYLANRIARNSHVREEQIMQHGRDIIITIMSMKQAGLFINNNPVREMSLRVEEPAKNKSWLIEKHTEAAW